MPNQHTTAAAAPGKPATSGAKAAAPAKRPAVVTPPRKHGGPAARGIEAHNPVPAAENAPIGERRVEKPIKVRATRVCYVGDKLRREGDVFYIDGTTFTEGPNKGKVIAFSDRAMELADKHDPEKETGSNEALQREHDAILRGRMAGAATTADDHTPRTPAAQQIPGERRELPPGGSRADDDGDVI